MGCRVDPQRYDVACEFFDVSFTVADVAIASRGNVCCRQRRLRREHVTWDILVDVCTYFVGIFVCRIVSMDVLSDSTMLYVT